MKIKATLLLATLLCTGTYIFANNNEDCVVTHSLFVEQAKIENYDAAYPYLQELRKNCASFHLSTYQYGERLYKHKIDHANSTEKAAIFNEYKQFYNERFQNFPEQTPEGKMLGDIAQAMYDNEIGTKMEQYKAFEAAYNKDKDNFTSPKSIYTYFSLAVDLFIEKTLPIEAVFELYDEIISKIEKEENDLASKITPLIEKQDAGTDLTTSEENFLKGGETNLTSYSKVKGSVNGKLGNIASCEFLVPIYQRDFEENKANADWLKGAAARLSDKECTEEISFQIAEALHDLTPTAESAYSLGLRAEKEGNLNVALDYYNQSAELFTDMGKKANMFYKIADIHRKRNSLSNARTFYRKAIDTRPSFGAAYLQLASMYANSSNDCGNTVFEKRAINWLAADLARTAARVDPSIASNANAAANSYMGRAPQKADIFQEGMEGKTITFNCWVGGSVRVPNL